ncbi:hypothetical protein QBC33DRAFT_181798 [Phialemonium atrogriseum]|uniref:Uncharacterized protein n=1 Tax=Phialemonium atrogriseum TaxID=1093897 RepID=A0AAJ0FL39_9PEZI|nr:uncharacterized protein QBC33DRAFT_181798 [Phialemonium atrogriseum]KAK1764715.1 hypothetical protein QBC33DRAFT_181798 [Phialemonium atrogriseum]
MGTTRFVHDQPGIRRGWDPKVCLTHSPIERSMPYLYLMTVVVNRQAWSTFHCAESRSQPPTSFLSIVDHVLEVHLRHTKAEIVGDGLVILGDLCWTSTLSEMSSIARYLADPQRHEWLAVSIAMADGIKAPANNAPAFTRSPTPSASTRRGLQYTGDNGNHKLSFVDPGVCGPREMKPGMQRPSQHEEQPRNTIAQSLQVNVETTSGSATSLGIVECLDKPKPTLFRPPSQH